MGEIIQMVDEIEEADVLICTNLEDEAKDNLRKLVDLRNRIMDAQRPPKESGDSDESVDMTKYDFDPSDHIYDLELIVKNFMSESDVFVEKFA